MGTQVITIAPNGTVSGLERKPNQGLDFKFLGNNAQIKRSSEIVWDEINQKWFIQFLQGHRTGNALDSSSIPEGLVLKSPYTLSQNNVLLFDNYDLAVDVEIQVLDHDRLNGLGILSF